MYKRLLILLKLTLIDPFGNLMRVNPACVLIKTALAYKNHAWEHLILGISVFEDVTDDRVFHAVNSTNKRIVLCYICKFGELCGSTATLTTLQVCKNNELVLAVTQNGFFPCVHADLNNFKCILFFLTGFVLLVLIRLGLTVSKG